VRLIRRSKEKLTLVVIYNHNFPANVAKVEALYRKRFPSLIHLMPFGTAAADPRVVPVYENSRYFGSFISQAAHQLPDAETYLFLADDALLHPRVDASNALHSLGVAPGFDALADPPRGLGEDWGFWSHAKGGGLWRLETQGLQPAGLLPEKAEAVRLFDEKGLKDYLTVRASQIDQEATDEATYELSYPLAWGWSDVLVVTRETLPLFAQYVGVLSASNLFVEIAIPTALVLASPQLTNMRQGTLKPRAIWNHQEREELLDFHKAKNLFREFPGDFFCIHPVKLSQFGER